MTRVLVDNLFHVRNLIEEVLTICRWDDTGVTLDLIDPVCRAAIEIGMTEEEIKDLIGEDFIET